MTRRGRLRAILAGEACIHPGSVFDPVSARIAEDLKFELGMFAGSTASLAVLGAPDLILITLTEFAEQCRRICRAGDLPLLVDADHGYGNALNAMRTVQEMETAGVAGATIEDTVLPRAYGDGKPGVLPIAEGVGKMRAALAARRDAEFVVVGRTSAMTITDTDDAVRRAAAYAEAGVDALFFTGVTEAAQLRAVRAVTDLPIILGGAGNPFAERAELAALGVRVALQGHQPIMAGFLAVYETLKALREGVPPKQLRGVPDAAFMQRVTRDSAISGAVAAFLGG